MKTLWKEEEFGWLHIQRQKENEKAKSYFRYHTTQLLEEAEATKEEHHLTGQ